MNIQGLPPVQHDEEAPSTPLWKNEREKMLLLPKKYHDFVAILFKKIKECCDGSLPGFPDPKTLTFSGETPAEYTFRCGPNMKISIPKGLNIENFHPRDIERLVESYAVEMSGASFTPEVWHGFPLFRLRGLKDQTKKKVENITTGPDNPRIKDRSFGGKLSRLDKKLLPGVISPNLDDNPPAENSLSDAEGVKKLKFVNTVKFPHIILKKKV